MDSFYSLDGCHGDVVTLCGPQVEIVVGIPVGKVKPAKMKEHFKQLRRHISIQSTQIIYICHGQYSPDQSGSPYLKSCPPP